MRPKGTPHKTLTCKTAQLNFMKDIKIATAQFENKSGDKDYNLSVIDQLSKAAAADGADIVAFHECSVTGYSFARHLSKEQMLDLAEFIPEGPSIKRLKEIAEKMILLFLPVFLKKTDKINCINLMYVLIKTG